MQSSLFRFHAVSSQTCTYTSDSVAYIVISVEACGPRGGEFDAILCCGPESAVLCKSFDKTANEIRKQKKTEETIMFRGNSPPLPP